jgi:plasmid stabilization system protein ParE
MSLPIKFHRAARAEFLEASAWYETKRHGLVLDFIAEIDRCLARVSENPFQYAFVRDDIRRIVVNRFPYNIYFRVEQHRIVVMAIFHASRDPGIWQARVHFS